jgi:hypothetical protein
MSSMTKFHFESQIRGSQSMNWPLILAATIAGLAAQRDGIRPAKGR